MGKSNFNRFKSSLARVFRHKVKRIQKLFNNVDNSGEIEGAMIRSNGTQEWYLNGQLHRTDGPAIEMPSGAKGWYFLGQRHRESGPAEEYPDGSWFWYRRGLLHRDGGPAVKYSDGTRMWYQNGFLHRQDGPAIEKSDGKNEWFIDGNKIAPPASEADKRLQKKVTHQVFRL